MNSLLISEKAKEHDVKIGIDFANDKAKFKWLAGLRSNTQEVISTYKCCSRGLLGLNFIYDVNKKQMTNYNAGAVYEVATGSYIGAKHESTKDVESFKLGKVLFYIYHNATPVNTIGAQVSWDAAESKPEFTTGF